MNIPYDPFRPIFVNFSGKFDKIKHHEPNLFLGIVISNSFSLFNFIIYIVFILLCFKQHLAFIIANSIMNNPFNLSFEILRAIINMFLMLSDCKPLCKISTFGRNILMDDHKVLGSLVFFEFRIGSWFTKNLSIAHFLRIKSF